MATVCAEQDHATNVGTATQHLQETITDKYTSDVIMDASVLSKKRIYSYISNI